MVALQCLQTMVKTALIIVKNLFCCNDDGYFPIVETTILSLCVRMSLLTKCVLLRPTRRVAHVKDDLLTFTENLWSNVLMGLIKVARSLVFYLHIESCLFFHRFFVMIMSICFRHIHLNIPLICVPPVIERNYFLKKKATSYFTVK